MSSFCVFPSLLFSFSMLLLCGFFFHSIRSYSIFIHRVRSIIFVVARSMHTACSWEQCVFFAISSIQCRDKYDETWNICEKSFIPLFFCRMHSCKYFFLLLLLLDFHCLCLYDSTIHRLLFDILFMFKANVAISFYNYFLPADVVLTNATRY